jgi:exonuclease III
MLVGTKNLNDKPESYWRPQILRHTVSKVAEEFAVHEVYFSDFGNKWELTEDAVSSRYRSVKELKAGLEKFISSGAKSMRCGDSNYEYFREDIELWLKHIDDPVLEYPSV